MNYRHGSKVWVEDRDLAWVAAEVTGFAGDKVQLVTVSGKKVSALPEKLFPRDADEEEHGGVFFSLLNLWPLFLLGGV